MKKKWMMTVILMLSLAICARTVRADFAWPAGITEIGEEAFQGNPTLETLELPEGLRAIGARAFSGCESLNTASLPASLETIGEDAFDGCGEALLITCEPDSAALDYARSHNLDYRADTTLRALVIGQTYTGTSRALQGPANDLRAMRFCLPELGWSVTARTNLSCAEILSAISQTFGAATENDLSLFYYSGHGEQDGSLVGKSGDEDLTPAQLRAALDAIPGRKVVIVDACYSGKLIEEDEMERGTLRTNGTGSTESTLNGAEGGAEDAGEQFVNAFEAAFRRMLLRGALNSGSYFVLTAARENEESQEGYISSDGSSRTMGFFTYGLCLGLGYNGISMKKTALAADLNADEAVSVGEMYDWAYARALELNAGQHASVWPENCYWFAPMRR